MESPAPSPAPEQPKPQRRTKFFNPDWTIASHNLPSEVALKAEPILSGMENNPAFRLLSYKARRGRLLAKTAVDASGIHLYGLPPESVADLDLACVSPAEIAAACWALELTAPLWETRRASSRSLWVVLLLAILACDFVLGGMFANYLLVCLPARSLTHSSGLTAMIEFVLLTASAFSIAASRYELYMSFQTAFRQVHLQWLDSLRKFQHRWFSLFEAPMIGSLLLGLPIWIAVILALALVFIASFYEPMGMLVRLLILICFHIGLISLYVYATNNYLRRHRDRLFNRMVAEIAAMLEMNRNHLFDRTLKSKD